MDKNCLEVTKIKLTDDGYVIFYGGNNIINYLPKWNDLCKVFFICTIMRLEDLTDNDYVILKKCFKTTTKVEAKR